MAVSPDGLGHGSATERSASFLAVEEDCHEPQMTLSFYNSQSVESEHEIFALASHSPAAGWRHWAGHSHGHLKCHAPLDPRKAWSMGSLSFAPIYAELHNQHRSLTQTRKSRMFGVMSNGLPLVMGIVVAIVAIATGEVSKHLSEWRTQQIQALLREERVFAAWLANTGIMLTLAMMGSLMVITCCRTSGSSGIPAVIGLLNGCDLRQEFTLASLAARFFGVTCSVASGLVAGPEGPMIFIGACVGALFSRIPSSIKVWEWLGRPPIGLNADVYLRDYIAIGAGCGIAAAFRAPIAGTLFVVEEAASHFNRRQLVKIFFAGLASLEVIAVGTRGAGLLEYRVTIGPNCQNWPAARSWGILWFVAIGLACGLAGAAFNMMNIRVMHLRARFAPGSEPLRRAVEILVLCLLTSTTFVLLPYFFKDRAIHLQAILSNSTGCLQDSLRNQLVSGSWLYHQGSSSEGELKYIPRPCVYGFQYDRYLCGIACDIRDSPDEAPEVREYARLCTSGLVGNVSLELQEEWAYCCNFENETSLRKGKFTMPSNTSCRIDLGKAMPTLQAEDYENTDGERLYNPMASMTMVPWSAVAQNLFLRGVPHVLPMPLMLVFFVCFFVLAAITAGSAIPSGLLLPQLICGALLGRMVTLVVNDPILKSVLVTNTFNPSDSIWSPTYTPFFSPGGPLPDDAVLKSWTGFPDPGIGAVVGAAAFLGGSGRITLFTTVMMVEITGDPLLILPVGIATLTAVVVGNLFTDGLYHSLIDVQSFPFLPDTWPKKMPYVQVRHALPGGSAEGSVQPVVAVPLRASVAQVVAALGGNTYKGFPILNAAGTCIGVAERHDLERVLREAREVDEDYVDIGKVTDPYPVMIRTRKPAVAAFDLFKRMEMRRLIVVDDNHAAVGVLTRRSLLPWVVEARIAHRGAMSHQFISRPSGFESPAASPRI